MSNSHDYYAPCSPCFHRFDNGTLFAVDSGSPSPASQPPLIMIHGPGADHRAVWATLGCIADDVRLITPDVRGSGRSRHGGPLDWDLLADDLAALLDHLGLSTAVIGGVSGGTGIALRFGLRHRARTTGLCLVNPVFGGTDVGFNDAQRRAFGWMVSCGEQALVDGVQALFPLVDHLPDPVRQAARAMMTEFDPESFTSTARFLADGSQPFNSPSELEAITIPSLLVSTPDALHPADIASMYAERMVHCVVTGDPSPQPVIEFIRNLTPH